MCATIKEYICLAIEVTALIGYPKISERTIDKIILIKCNKISRESLREYCMHVAYQCVKQYTTDFTIALQNIEMHNIFLTIFY